MSVRWILVTQLALGVVIVALAVARQWLWLWIPVPLHLWMTWAPPTLWPYRHVPQHRAGSRSPSTSKGSAA